MSLAKVCLKIIFFSNTGLELLLYECACLQIGSSSARQNLSNIPASQPQPLGQLPAMPQRDLSQSSRSSVPSMLPPSTSAPLPSQTSSQQTQPQRRTQRSKLPPPSKVSATCLARWCKLGSGSACSRHGNRGFLEKQGRAPGKCP